MHMGDDKDLGLTINTKFSAASIPSKIAFRQLSPIGMLIQSIQVSRLIFCRALCRSVTNALSVSECEMNTSAIFPASARFSEKVYVKSYVALRLRSRGGLVGLSPIDRRLNRFLP